MAQIAKAEAKADIKCSAAKMFDFFNYSLKQIPNILPQVVKKVELVEGEEGQPGNVQLCEYVLDKTMSAKLKTVEINEKEKWIIYEPIEGEILEAYTTFKVKYSFCDCCVKVSIDYEKKYETIPNPDGYLILAAQIIAALDVHLLST